MFKRGLLFMLPLLVTAWVFSLVYSLAEAYLGPVTDFLAHKIMPVSWLPYFHHGHVPGLSLVLLSTLVLLFGWVASWSIGRRLIDRFFESIPIVHLIYTSARKLAEIAVSTRVVELKLWPGSNARIYGLVTSMEVDLTNGKTFLKVWAPACPPTSGLVIKVPESETIPSPLTPAEVLKLVASAGADMPPAAPREDQDHATGK